MTVTFEFELDQQVTTIFGAQGIVTMLSVDDGGVKYYVATGAGGNWLKATQMTAI